MVCWAANFIVVKAAIEVVPPISFSFVRFGLAALVLLAVLKWREGSVALPRRDVLPIAVLGMLGFGIYQDLWSTALGHTSAGTSALLIAATPIPTLVLSVLIGTERLTRAKAIGALVSFGGVAIVVGAGNGLSLSGASLGDLMTLVAACCWSVYVAFGAPILQRHSPLRTTSWAIAFGTLGMAPLGVWELRSFDVSTLTPAILGAVLYSGVLAGSVSNVTVFHAIRLVGPARVTVYQFLVPAMAVVMAAVFLGEPILAAQVAGGAVIVAGIVVARSGRGMSAVGRRVARRVGA